MQPENQDEGVASAPESTQGWAEPSSDPIVSAQTDARFAVEQPYQTSQTSSLPTGAVPPVHQGSSERARKHKWRVAWLAGIVALAVVIVADVISSHRASDQNAAQSTVPAVSDDGASADASSAPPYDGNSLPASAGDLVHLDTTQAQTAVAGVRRTMSAVAGGVFDNALVGAYGKTPNGDYTVILVAQTLTNVPAADQSEIASESPSDMVSRMSKAMHDPTIERTSDPSAAMTCGTIIAGVTFVLCFWDDSHMFGAGYFYGTTSLDDAAMDTDLLRLTTEALN